MTNPEIPADLLEAKRAFYALETAHAEFCASLPPEPTEDQRGRLETEQRSLTEAALRIHRHEAFEGLSQVERYELNKAASKVARDGLQAP